MFLGGFYYMKITLIIRVVCIFLMLSQVGFASVTVKPVMPVAVSRQSLMDIHRITQKDLDIKIPQTRTQALEHLGIMSDNPSKEEITKAYEVLRQLPVNQQIQKFIDDRNEEYRRGTAHDEQQLLKDNQSFKRRFKADQQAANILLRSAR